MQHLHKLLTTENSQLAQILKLSLHGLEATLNQARTEQPQDPGAETCDQLLQEIHNLLHPQPQIITLPSELKLTHLRDTLNTELHTYLENTPLQSQTDPELWQEIHRKLLRIPEELAITWRQQTLNLAQQIGAKADHLNLIKLPFSRNEIIYPGLNGTIKAPGLCLSEKALFNCGIDPNAASQDIYSLAGIVQLLLKFIDIDPELHHALKSVFSFDIVHLQTKPEQRTQYIDTLSDRLHRIQKAEANLDPLSTLKAAIEIDEAIHSLIFIPPAERYSWWGKLQQESRRVLKSIAQKAINAGHQVKIRQLSGLYADVCALSKDDLQLDCGGIPGEVLTCLRVYARINQQESPGRVIFRSLK
jgi:hypothetical protein